MRGADDSFYLVHDHLLHSLSGRLQIASRVEIRRILAECFTDGTCHSQTDIGVDIDLADSHRGSLAEHVFRDAFRAEDFAAIGIALFHKFRNDGRSAMEDDRVVRQELADLFQTFIVKIGVAFEFVSSVAGADRNSERVASGKLYELSRFFRIRKDRILCIDTDQIFYAGQTSELASTTTPLSCAYSTICFVTLTFSSKECFEPSYMTEVKPPSMQALQIS